MYISFILFVLKNKQENDLPRQKRISIGITIMASWVRAWHYMQPTQQNDADKKENLERQSTTELS